MGLKFKTGGPKPVMRVTELESLLERSANGLNKLLELSFKISDVGISDLDPGSYKHQYFVQ